MSTYPVTGWTEINDPVDLMPAGDQNNAYQQYSLYRPNIQVACVTPDGKLIVPYLAAADSRTPKFIIGTPADDTTWSSSAAATQILATSDVIGDMDIRYEKTNDLIWLTGSFSDSSAGGAGRAYAAVYSWNGSDLTYIAHGTIESGDFSTTGYSAGPCFGAEIGTGSGMGEAADSISMCAVLWSGNWRGCRFFYDSSLGTVTGAASTTSYTSSLLYPEIVYKHTADDQSTPTDPFASNNIFLFGADTNAAYTIPLTWNGTTDHFDIGSATTQITDDTMFGGQTGTESYGMDWSPTKNKWIIAGLTTTEQTDPDSGIYSSDNDPPDGNWTSFGTAITYSAATDDPDNYFKWIRLNEDAAGVLSVLWSSASVVGSSNANDGQCWTYDLGDDTWTEGTIFSAGAIFDRINALSYIFDSNLLFAVIHDNSQGTKRGLQMITVDALTASGGAAAGLGWGWIPIGG